MTAFTRWCKFNAVGAMGMSVQMAVLAVLNKVAPGRYQWTSAIAVEVAVLHNFVWHVHYTWSDRKGLDRFRTVWPLQLLRFHFSNGLTSLLGNWAIMRLLVRGAHCPVLVANGTAIVVCSVVNFGLGNKWAFASSQPLSEFEEATSL